MHNKLLSLIKSSKINSRTDYSRFYQYFNILSNFEDFSLFDGISFTDTLMNKKHVKVFFKSMYRKQGKKKILEKQFIMPEYW